MDPEYLDCELCLTAHDQASLTVAGIEHSGRPALDDALLAKLLASLASDEICLPPGGSRS